jgi:hypothetical protein
MWREPCECEFETWVTLEGRMVRVWNKLTVFRTDSRWRSTIRAQELPAVYPIADLNHVVTYQGSRPFSGGSMSQIADSPAFWEQWHGTENWAACVNGQKFGVGVYSPPRIYFTGGLYRAQTGGARDDATCYLAPEDALAFSKSADYHYRYFLIVGSLGEIRQQVYELNGRLQDGQS